MSRAGVDSVIFQESLSPSIAIPSHDSLQSAAPNHATIVTANVPNERRDGPRRTPRKSLIVVLPENHVVSPDLVTARLSEGGSADDTDVILACAGQPTSIAALQRRVRDLQILLAPAGTTGEDLRELAMNQAPGDIITLMGGIPAWE
jgi:hypothetical protein